MTNEHLNQTVCFSFDDAEAQSIISQQSLFGEHQRDNAHFYHDDQKSQLIYLEEKNIRLKWHGIALSEYWRKKQIPRGLRIYKKPALGKGDTEFMNKWERILNKCSLDLTLLIIEQTKKDAEKVMTEIQELKTEINTPDTTQVAKLEEAIKEGLAKFEDELKAFKIEKYERDAEDYRRGSVYKWDKRRQQKPQTRGQRSGQRGGQRGGHRRGEQRQKERHLLLTSEAETSDQGSSSASSSTDGPFLGQRGGHTYRKGRGGAKGRSRDPNRFTRSLNRT